MKKPAQLRKKNFAAEGVPVEETNLTAEERALLPNPAIVTEDDADAITARRRKNEPTVSLDDLLKRYGTARRRPLAG